MASSSSCIGMVAVSYTHLDEFSFSENIGYGFLGAEDAQKFMKSFGYNKAIEQYISEYDVEMRVIDPGSTRTSTQKTGNLTVLSEKVTYAKDDQYGVVKGSVIKTEINDFEYIVKSTRTNYRNITSKGRADYRRTNRVKNQFTIMDFSKLIEEIGKTIMGADGPPPIPSTYRKRR